VNEDSVKSDSLNLGGGVEVEDKDLPANSYIVTLFTNFNRFKPQEVQHPTEDVRLPSIITTMLGQQVDVGSLSSDSEVGA